MICFQPYHSSNSLKIPRHRILGVLFVTFSVSPANYGPPWKEDPLSVMLPDWLITSIQALKLQQDHKYYTLDT